MSGRASISREGDPVVERLLGLLREPERELLLRCAVPRSFDLAAFDKVLMPEAPRSLLDGLVGLGLVERVRGGSAYRVPPAVRAAELGAWTQDRPALRELSGELARHWESIRPAESLYHLILADPGGAVELFRERYAAAEEAFDLAGCGTLLAILDERLDDLDDVLRSVRDAYRVRYARHVQWSEDWHRTRRFLERRHVRGVFEDLLAGPPPQVLRLQAAGGMGKTMHLRWFVARLCVPRGIPCARIDFDSVVPTVALQEPWLVLLAVADQLNHQLAGSPLSDLLAQDAAEELPRLWRGRGAQGRSARRRQSLSGLDDPTRHRLESAINGLSTELPLVVILDTLEVASLRTGASLAPLVGNLRMLQQACPAMRLLFAGRLDLEHEIPEHADLFAGALSLPLTPFDRAERESYLSGIRGIEDGALVATIASRSDGNPFKLSLIADLVADLGDLGADDLEAYEQVDLMYLLERVLLRIDEMDVRWVLRYGAMPRQLDRGLLERAMAPVLADEMQQTLRERRDDPDRGLPPKVAGTWARDGAPEDLDAVWTALRRYGKEASWVVVTGAPPDDTLHFSADVVQPMRRLVRKQEIFEELHARCADDFRRRAQEQSRLWARWTREELYHRLLADPRTGADIVRQRLAEARLADLEEVVDDLLSREYAVAELFGEPDDEAGAGDTRPAAPAALVAEVLHLSAMLALPAVRRGDHVAWDRCRQTIVRLDRVQGACGEAVAPDRVVAIRVALGLHDPARGAGHRRRMAAEWAEPLRSAIDRLEDQQEQVQALVLLAALHANAEPQATEEALQRALAIARAPRRGGGRSAVRPISPLTIAQATAEHVFREGDIRRARQLVGNLATDLHDRPRDAARLNVQEARFLIAAGQPVAASALVTQAMEGGHGGVRLRAGALRARALLEARRPDEVIGACPNVPGVVEKTAGAGRETSEAVAVEFVAIVAAACAAQGAPEQALDALERGEFVEAARTGSAARRLLSTRLDIELRVLGDSRAAGLTVQRAGALLNGPEDYPALLLLLQRIEWLADGPGDRDAAVSELRSLAAELVSDGAPRGYRIRAAIEGLVLAEEPDEHLGVLTRELALVQPPTARLAMLRELARVERLPDGPLTRRLRGVANEALEAEELRDVSDPHDRLLLHLVAADVERVTGGDEAAAEVLVAVSPDGTRVDADWVHAAARARLSGGTIDRAMVLLRRLEERAPGLAAPAALAVAQARLGAADGSDDHALEALAIAERTLAGESTPTRAHARLAELRVRHGVEADGDDHQRAHQRYKRLGNVSGMARIEALRPAPAEPGDADGLHVSLDDLPDWLRTLIAVNREEAVPWPLVRGLGKGWPNFAAGLRDVLTELLDRHPGGRQGDHLRLILEDTRAHVIPWELAVADPPGSAISVSRELGSEGVQAALRRLLRRGSATIEAPAREVTVEGVTTMWRETRGADLPRPRVLVLMPAGRLADVQVRSSEDWLHHILDAYSSAGFEPECFELEGDWDFTPAGGGPLSVLHVMAPFVDAEGTPAIDLAGTSRSRALHRASKGGPGAIHASRFRRMAVELATAGVPPLLVLDPPPPLNELELGVQLCLRNAFAGTLFDAGAFDSILAGGLLPNHIRWAGYRTLADALGDGVGIAPAAGHLRRRTIAALAGRESLLAPSAIAAYSVHPDLPAPFTAPPEP